MAYENVKCVEALRETSFLIKSILYYVICSQFAIGLQTDYFDSDNKTYMSDLLYKVHINGTQGPLFTEEELIVDDSSLNNGHRKKRSFPFKFKYKPFKYVLIWTPPEDFYPYVVGYGIGQTVCKAVNCYITDNRDFFDGDITRFFAVAFNGRVINSLEEKDLPKVRTPGQKYIYGNSESPDNYPLKHPYFDNYFNWTFTYKLDSDFVFRYFVVKNKKGEVIGPKNDMTWEELDNELPSWLNNNSNMEIITKNNKRKAAAWFVSNCHTFSGREFFVDELNHALKKYNLKVDVFGECGEFQCSRFMADYCNRMLRRDYFFYMALENSFASDYVTEKVLTALNNDLVPIVYGGANYSKFLPPNSYINARSMKPTQLAAMMYKLMNNIPLYLKYFEWKKYYTFELARSNVCVFCDAINDETKFRAYSSHKELRKWWNEKNSVSSRDYVPDLKNRVSSRDYVPDFLG